MFCLLLASKEQQTKAIRIEGFRVQWKRFPATIPNPKSIAYFKGWLALGSYATALDLHFKCMLVCCGCCSTIVPSHCGLLLGQLLVLTMPLTADDSISCSSCCCLNATACGLSSYCGHADIYTNIYTCMCRHTYVCM